MANKKYIDLYKCREDFYNDVLIILSDDTTNDRANEIIDVFDSLPAADVQEVKHGHWIFKNKTKLVPTDKLAIKEGYCQVNNHNLDKAVMILKRHIIVKEPICSFCGYRGYDECDATAYCPNCGARMDGEDGGENG